ncbi:hypothetical protein [Streptomyces sp. NPDC057301]|uniref:hypothetical protein n=1 Tax=Streptomyces sp. NPDC057301 TaxID=3346093 RepID=UPI003643E677
MFLAVKAMPEVSDLFDRARALATVCLIGRDTEDYPPEDRGSDLYAMVRRETGWKFTLRNQAQLIDLHFTDSGVLLAWWWREALFHSGEYEDEWRAILGQIPEPLRVLVEAPDAMEGDHADVDQLPLLSGVMWRLPQHDTWQIPDFTHPESVIPSWIADMQEGDYDYIPPELRDREWKDDDASDILCDLITPKPDDLYWPHQIRQQGMRGSPHPNWEWLDPQDIAWPDTGLTTAQALHHVLSLRPVTDQIVQTFHPTRTLADVVDSIVATGYPQHGEQVAPAWYYSPTGLR